jgi:hypothetical protein
MIFQGRERERKGRQALERGEKAKTGTTSGNM